MGREKRLKRVRPCYTISIMFELAASLFIIAGAATYFVLRRVYEFNQLSPDVRLYGPLAPELVCPHCRVSGRVHARPYLQPGAPSRAKAIAAVLTAGLSLLAVGLAHREVRRRARCAQCHARWTI